MSRLRAAIAVYRYVVSMVAVGYWSVRSGKVWLVD
jgi:hypothetical protein